MDDAGAWAASGAMALTGPEDGPALGGPRELIAIVSHAVDVIVARTDGRVRLDGLALLGERAAISGLRRRGAVSCGGGTRLLRAIDGWLAVAFPRADDIASLPAWLERDVPDSDPWPAVAAAIAATPAHELDERAAVLGLPVGGCGSVGPPAQPVLGQPVAGARLGDGDGAPGQIAGARVVDLSSLWAGPLCAQLLGAGGAEVIKVESLSRPDGARRGPAAFFDLLNGGKRSVVVDLDTDDGRRALGRLVTSADIVIDGARPRALEQLGIVAADLLRTSDGPCVWVSITGQGRARGDRVAFGDVAAVAGGLVVDDGQGPCFVADAVADPLTGLVAAAAALEAIADGGRWLIDAGMAPTAASAAGEPLAVEGLDAAPPRARVAAGRAPAFGADTDSVLAALRA